VGSRHTYATFALQAGVPVLAVSRFMGSSIAMIDHRYGHLAHDGRQQWRGVAVGEVQARRGIADANLPRHAEALRRGLTCARPSSSFGGLRLFRPGKERATTTDRCDRASAPRAGRTKRRSVVVTRSSSVWSGGLARV
jgi:hypothetical protein